MTTINDRLALLRREMATESIDVMIFPSTDPHASEYVAPHWHAREWVSGFDGSAGTAVVTRHEAALWTDSRYFLQAAEQLQGSEFQLMKEGLADTPTVLEWVLRKLSVEGGTCVAVDGMVMDYEEVEDMKAELRHIGATVRTNYDAMAVVWKDRPALPHGAIRVHPLEYAGEMVESKLARLREAMTQQRCQAHLLTDLMCVAWLTNLRGCDVPRTPVFLAYMYVTMDEAWLFVGDKYCHTDTPELDEAWQAHVKEAGVQLLPYDDIKDFLRKRMESHPDERVWGRASYTLYNIIKGTTDGGMTERTVSLPSPVILMKAKKNEAEIEGFRRSMLRDGVAMVKFLRWLKPAVEAGGQTEISVSDKLESLRREAPECFDLSFDTIAGYNAHGAIVHYTATPESDAPLAPEGLILIDSGAQYCDGTTDITRTIALGPVTDEMRRVYTTVLKANIALATVPYPEGTTGSSLDTVAHQVVWRAGYNYLHGTGHGVGACLSVHEGPQRVGQGNHPTPLVPGMTITDEPGVYLADRFGVRIENTMTVVEHSEGEFGRYFQLQPLTLCPIDTTPIDVSLMTEEEIEWLDNYHQRVKDELLPLLAEESDRRWLVESTKPLSKMS